MNTNNDFLDTMRKTGDAEADHLMSWAFQTGAQNDLYQALNTADEQLLSGKGRNTILDFILGRRPNPGWFDAERILSGQKVFTRFALPVMTLLGSLSLPYCYAATPGNKALYYTGKMRDTPGKRLTDTAQFIIAVMKEGSFAHGGAGHIAVNKTRLIHALVRYHLQKNHWNEAWGSPVNQEDMAGTNLAFSYMILLGLSREGYPVQQQQMEDFLFVWRYVGYLLQLNEELLPASLNEAAQLERAIRRRHFHPSQEGRELMTDLLNHYERSFPRLAGYFIEPQIRYFVGDEVANLLGLRHNPLRDQVVRQMNGLKKLINRSFNDPESYAKMLQNHEDLKRRYSAG